MNWQMFKGYFAAIFSGLMLVLGTVLVTFQWANISEFSLFGYSYDIMAEGNRYGGGVNTALLMLFSAGGGIAVLFLVKMLIRGLTDISGGKRHQAETQTARRLEELEKAAHKTTENENA